MSYGGEMVVPVGVEPTSSALGERRYSVSATGPIGAPTGYDPGASPFGGVCSSPELWGLGAEGVFDTHLP